MSILPKSPIEFRLKPPKILTESALTTKNYARKPINFKSSIPKLPSINLSKKELDSSEVASVGPFRTFRSIKSQDSLPQPPDPVKFHVVKTHAGCINAGQSKVNQDSYFQSSRLDEFSKHVFGICDGHGTNGELVSQYVAANISRVLAQKIRVTAKNQTQLKQLTQALLQSHFQLEKDLIQKSKIDVSFSGTTCITNLIWGDNILCSNVGDSRAVYYFKNNVEGNQGTLEVWNSKNLSNDHKPSRPQEYKRILQSKGRVEQSEIEGRKVGPLRVWLQNEDTPGLAMTRSLGDNVVKSVGVICEPEIYHYKLQRSGFLLIASDGVWDQIENFHICMILNNYFPPQSQADVDKAAAQLLKEVIKNWEYDHQGRDDITFQLIFIDL